MTIRNLLFACFLMLGFVGQTAKAQSLSIPVDISFGQMVVGGVGTITIPSSSDTRSTTGLVALVTGAFVQRGRIDITFTPGAQVTISVPASIAMTGANSPTLVPTIEGGTTQTIPAGGVLTVYFGGTMSFTTFGTYGVATVVIPVTVDPV